MVWLLPVGCGDLTGISQDAEMRIGFPPHQVALVIATFREKGLWVEWCSDSE